MSKKNIVITVAVAVVFGAGGFFGGMKYQQSRPLNAQSFANMTQQQRQQAFQGMAGGSGSTRVFTGGRGNLPGGGGFMSGEIISKDGNSVTIKAQDGSSKIVFYSGSTTVGKMIQGTADELAVGDQVTVTGTANSDGTMTAQSIQVRPEMLQRSGNQ